MADLSLILEPQEPDDHAAIEKLDERAFGPGRFARSAYRLRQRADAAAFANECSPALGPIMPPA